ncbi:hypothetical protein JCM33374_g3023 [Metschnikowia sp. JCM 33374]|nr:hypothetical protein JCM33374_g3023 [Metschnikowia sp. JCM 33374]
MLDPDSLVATRARRANAGSRLKQLIEIEEQATGVSNIVYSEEDENVQLLFQEDENDEEFEESEANDSGSDEEGNEDEEEEEGEGITRDRAGTEDSSKENKTSDAESVVNSDEMLSDSDISASENDDSEGERELQKHEREKKRKTKTSSIIPAIKKPKLSTEKPKPKPKAKHSELLLNLDRRASSRKSAMRNKEILVQKLKEDETRRAALTPIVRVDEVQLTQEDRLAQAVETEKENVLSLHSFLEQEIVKKEHQKLLFQQRRPKLRNVIRLLSRETFVAPIDEIEDARQFQELLNKKKNKGRRRKNAPEIPEEPRPGDIDTELPYYKKEMEEKRIREEKEAAEREKIEREREEQKLRIEEEEKRRLELDQEHMSQNIADGEGAKESENFKGAENTKVSGETENESIPADSILENTQSQDNQDVEVVSNMPITEEAGIEPAGDGISDIANIEDKKEEQKEIAIEEEAREEETEKENPEHIPGVDDSDDAKSQEDHKESIVDKEEEKDTIKMGEKSAEAVKEPHEPGPESVTDAPIEVENEPSPITKDSTPIENTSSDERKVKFADSEGITEEPQLEEISEEFYESDEGTQTKSSYRASKDGDVFEGPVQQVGRNHIILMNFDEEQYPYLSEPKIKTVLFGDESNLGASRRFRDVKTILKSSIRSDNPYTTPREEKEDELLKPVTEITEEDAMFEALKRLPRLGVKETFEEEEEDVQKEEAAEIQIRTEAPSGLYLPNGNKKLCLISGREVRYFDPATGLPYENKDVYKTIKTIEQGLIPWYSIGKDQNAYGEIEIYLNHRGGIETREGCPRRV